MFNDSCLPVEERPDTMQGWTCDQMDEFYAMAKFYRIEGYIIKSI